jgi:hypothetical protein
MEPQPAEASRFSRLIGAVRHFLARRLHAAADLLERQPAIPAQPAEPPAGWQARTTRDRPPDHWLQAIRGHEVEWIEAGSPPTIPAPTGQPESHPAYPTRTPPPHPPDPFVPSQEQVREGSQEASFAPVEGLPGTETSQLGLPPQSPVYPSRAIPPAVPRFRIHPNPGEASQAAGEAPSPHYQPMREPGDLSTPPESPIEVAGSPGSTRLPTVSEQPQDAPAVEGAPPSSHERQRMETASDLSTTSPTPTLPTASPASPWPRQPSSYPIPPATTYPDRQALDAAASLASLPREGMRKIREVDEELLELRKASEAMRSRREANLPTRLPVAHFSEPFHPPASWMPEPPPTGAAAGADHLERAPARPPAAGRSPSLPEELPGAAHLAWTSPAFPEHHGAPGAGENPPQPWPDLPAEDFTTGTPALMLEDLLESQQAARRAARLDLEQRGCLWNESPF